MLPLAGSTVAPCERVKTGARALTSASLRTVNEMTLSVENTTFMESVAWKKNCSGYATCSIAVSMSASHPLGSSPKQDVFNSIIATHAAMTNVCRNILIIWVISKQTIFKPAKVDNFLLMMPFFNTFFDLSWVC